MVPSSLIYIFLIVCGKVLFQSSPDRFMNQHNYTNIGVMSAALFMDDREGYEKAVEWFTVNRSTYNQGHNGSILRLFREIKTLDEVDQKEGTDTPLVAPVIQHMEMGRDQAHGYCCSMVRQRPLAIL